MLKNDYSVYTFVSLSRCYLQQRICQEFIKNFLDNSLKISLITNVRKFFLSFTQKKNLFSLQILTKKNSILCNEQKEFFF